MSHAEPKTYWIEIAPNGEKLFCYQVRKHGKKIVVKLSAAELMEILG